MTLWLSMRLRRPVEVAVPGFVLTYHPALFERRRSAVRRAETFREFWEKTRP